MKMLLLDFETRSHCDLPNEGAYNYALDPTTDILCCAFYDMDTMHQYVWHPDRGPLPDQILYTIEHADFIVAHNAEFDMGIWEAVGVPDYGFPQITPDRWYCSSAQCRVNGLPAALDDAAWALKLKKRKDPRGKALIKALSLPQEDGTFNEDPELMQEMYEYCLQDVLVTADIMNRTRLMTQDEHADWLATVEMNLRGVKIDRQLADLAQEYAADEQEAIGELLAELTDGQITKHTQTARVREWVLDRVFTDNESDPVKEAMTVYKKGEKKYSLDKNVRRNLLALIDEGHIVDDTLAEVIQLLDDGNKSSVAKFKRMVNLADVEDDRVRGAFVFAGAGSTLRYTSRGLQLHNMRRDCFSPDEAEDIIQDMVDDYELDNVMDTLSKMLRPAIIPEPGNALIVSDWSAIEARVMPWLVNTPAAEKKLDLFRRGVDVYIHSAEAMGLGPEDRQTGKVAELALGYQGGIKAFQAMARNYGLTIPDAKAQRIVDQWRAANPWAVAFWKDLERAAKLAIGNPGKYYTAGRVSYVYIPELIDGTLLCALPGNNSIQYPKAKIESVETPFGMRPQITALKASFKPKADAKEWPRSTLYGGLLAENVTQAMAAAILRSTIRSMPDVIAHVHDEIVQEVPKHQAGTAITLLTKAMTQGPDWAEGLPLNCEAQVLERYGK